MYVEEEVNPNKLYFHGLNSDGREKVLTFYFL